MGRLGSRGWVGWFERLGWLVRLVGCRGLVGWFERLGWLVGWL